VQPGYFESAVFAAAVDAGDARTSPDLIKALDGAFALIRFDYFRVVEAVADGEARVLRYMLGKADPEWEAAYEEDQLAQHDLRLRRALSSSEPFFLTEALAGSDVRDAERKMVRLAQKFGIGESYVLPYRDTENRQFAAVLIGPGQPIDGRYRVAAHTLASALMLGALRVEAAASGGSEKLGRPQLTIRQLQCLEWSRRGKSSGDIGKILGLSARTIDEHFAMACKAIGVRTRMQAVAMALSFGLLPYRAADISGSDCNP
jgi:LuxR family quorum-sensing transcriptional regulator LasR